jgi:acyl-CoA synthetase (AMP-forming)/AMP-acid ligase II
MFRDGWIGDSRAEREKVWLPHALAVHRLYFNVGVYRTEFEPWVGHCLERMATFKVPRYVRFVSEWPMSGTKIQKGRLRQRIADELAAAAATEAPRMTRPT